MRFLLPFLIMGLFNIPLLAGENKEALFWRWFQKNDDRLFAFEKDRDKIFGELTTAINKVQRNLTFEFGPVRQDGRREFVISAGGIKTAFPAVDALHAAAPKLKRWTFL